MNKLSCFIAMAFGFPETDYIFDKVICTTLNELSINPRRIDRLNHQERIDQKIKSEIEKADFVIADLTFARPSVYYEAGYAERFLGKSVIYIMAFDHLGKQMSDSFGNFRVHFDLQNANIITWKIQDLDNFMIGLKNRVNYVIKPINEKRDQEKLIEKERQKFSVLSSIGKRTLIDSFSSTLIMKLGFNKTFYNKNWVNGRRYSKNEQLIYYKNCEDKLDYLLLLPCVENIAKNYFQFLDSLTYNFFINHYLISFKWFANLNRLRKKFKIINQFVIVNLLTSVSNSRISSYLQSYTKFDDSDIFFMSHEFINQNETFIFNKGFIFIKSIKSLTDLENQISTRLMKIRTEI